MNPNVVLSGLKGECEIPALNNTLLFLVSCNISIRQEGHQQDSVCSVKLTHFIKNLFLCPTLYYSVFNAIFVCLPAAQAGRKLKTIRCMQRKSTLGFNQWADHTLKKISQIKEEDCFIQLGECCCRLAGLELGSLCWSLDCSSVLGWRSLSIVVTV